MACIYLPNFIVGLMKICFIGGVFLFVTMIIMILLSRDLIMNNWNMYRCNPFIMMFAWYFGHSGEDTMYSCSYSNMKSMSPTLFKPFFSIFKGFSQSFDMAGGAMEDMNSIIGNVSTLFQHNFNFILDKMDNVGSAIQYLVAKMKVLLDRLSATLLLLIYSVYSVLQGLRAIQKDKGLEKAVGKLKDLSEGKI